MKHFAYKLTLFIVLLAGLQAGLTWLNLSKERAAKDSAVEKEQSVILKETKKRLAEFDRVLKNADYVLFGDSVEFSSAPDDVDKSSIGSMAAALLRAQEPEKKILSMASKASHATLYLAYIEYALRSVKKTPVFIIPINMRSFTATWRKMPRWQFLPMLKLLANPGADSFLYKCIEPLCQVFHLRLKKQLPLPITQDEYMDSAVYVEKKLLGYLKNYEAWTSDPEAIKTHLPEIIAFRYLEDIRWDNDTLKSFMAIARLATESRNLKVIFYFTPVDYEYCVQYGGPDFMRLFNERKKTVQTALAEYGFEALDFSLALPSACFNHPIDPHEHLNDRGRKAVAEKLVEAVLAKRWK